MKFGFQHTYAALPGRFYARVAPARVPDPQLVVFNRALAEELGLAAEAVERSAAVLFSGNELPEDASPIAMAYAGHQFGGFVPQLGDGRAILLGEIEARDGVLRDVQLKGSGRTPFSRNGDGRAALGPMLREYLVSESMHALGIPTTRSLAVVTTGDLVYREGALPGAVLTRVAASHIRVGTFQFFAARDDQEGVEQLLDYVVSRHYPEAREAAAPALKVLELVAERQAALIADWICVGFIHGVMNTDNMAVSGETIDYGPCAFMDEYDPNTVFSSIDHYGRYAYANQPRIAQWDLARFAETLLPLIDADTSKAIERATEVIGSFIARFDAHYLDRMRRKLGLASAEEGDAQLVEQLLSAMKEARADFTLAFRGLSRSAGSDDAESALRKLFADPAAIDQWLLAWQARLTRDPQTAFERANRMLAVNPAFIPRNHRVAAALDAASGRGDFTLFHRLLGILQRPFAEQPEAREYELPPEPSERVLQTFCGT